MWFGNLSLLIGFANNKLNYFLFGFLSQFSTTVGLVLFFVLVLHKGKLADLGIKPIRAKLYWQYGVLGGLILLVVMVTVGIPIRFLQPDIEPQYFEEVLRMVSNNKEFLGVFLIGSVLAPLSEELLFRGMLYPVVKFRMGIFWGAIIAGTIFGLAHWDFWRTIPLAVGGAILCYIYEKTDSIFVSAISHGIWNGIMSWGVFLNL